MCGDPNHKIFLLLLHYYNSATAMNCNVISDVRNSWYATLVKRLIFFPALRGRGPHVEIHWSTRNEKEQQSIPVDIFSVPESWVSVLEMNFCTHRTGIICSIGHCLICSIRKFMWRANLAKLHRYQVWSYQGLKVPISVRLKPRVWKFSHQNIQFPII